MQGRIKGGGNGGNCPWTPAVRGPPSFDPAKCVNFSDFETVSIGGVHCLSFPGCLFVVLVRWPSRILLFSLNATFGGMPVRNVWNLLL